MSVVTYCVLGFVLVFLIDEFVKPVTTLLGESLNFEFSLMFTDPM